MLEKMTYRSKRARDILAAATKGRDTLSSQPPNTTIADQSSGSEAASPPTKKQAVGSLKFDEVQNEKWGPFGPPKTTTSAQSPSINPESIWKKPPTTPTPSLIMEAAKDKQGCSQKTTPKLTAIVSPNMPPNMPPIAPEPFRHPSTSSSATHQPFRHPSTCSPATHQPFRHPSTSSPATHQQFDLHQPSKQGLQNQASSAAKSSNAAPQNKNQTQQNIGEASKEVPKKSKSLRHNLLPDWREDIEFDDKEEVLTIDDKGNTTLVSGVIHPVDVLNAKGFKYVVEFNDLCQPIRKGGHVLIKFIGYLAKMESHCPLGPTDWKKIDGTIKGNVVTNMRDHFVIPDGKEYDKQALQRANKAWTQYKFELKKLYFKPKEKTMGEMKTQPPARISPLNWTALVDYWYSDKAQSLAECGKRARSFLNQYHRCGNNSYANQQADYEDEHGEPMSLLALWIKSHSGKDGSFLPGTDTEDFVDDVKAKVEQLRLMYPMKSQTELENEAFEKTMYSDEIPDRPVGYGQGVNKGDIYGVHGVLRKEGYGKFQRRVNLMDNVKEDVATLYKKNEVLEKENEKLKDQVPCL
ncbi:uncharacterized protein LOC110706958 isoform X1 [Chenopodium quinoa]|uniref:uncharacterized protein LOC110706958 isoform X1 n=2 Tax=Chenopodium quinoa TaxID=63459 RepID=UPI000B78E056|nr:uncharacterized protein LOC110706958 isoform X1 [Chenopodium quinoa]